MLSKIKQTLFRPLGGFVPASVKDFFSRINKSLWKLAIVIIILASVITIYNEAMYWLSGSGDYYSDEIVAEEVDSDCNIVALELHGQLLTYLPPENIDEDGNIIADQTASETILAGLSSAEDDSTIKGIFLEVDSYGGSPVGGEEIAKALKKVSKPTVVLIREGGASGAYLAATGADKIFASANSDVGGIGVTMSYLGSSGDYSDTGLVYNNLSAGRFKDAGNPEKPLTAEERRLLMRDVNIIHDNFIATVAQNRHLDIAKVRELADGSTMLGQMALDNGLIDAIGSYDEAFEYLKETIGEEVSLCWW